MILDRQAFLRLGDTIVFTFELDINKHLQEHLFFAFMLIGDYLFRSLQRQILFRGAFSFGSYIEDEENNTVMGEALSDAANWYEKSDFMGVHSTPKANNFFDFHYVLNDDIMGTPLLYYNVPLKDKSELRLLTILWPRLFFPPFSVLPEKIDQPERAFLHHIKDLPIPLGTESKYINTRKYFDHVAKIIKNKPDK